MAAPCRLTALFAQYAQQARAQNSFSGVVSKRLQFMGMSENRMTSSFQIPLHQYDCHAFGMPREGQTAHASVIALLVADLTGLHLQARDPRERRITTCDLSLDYLGVAKVGRTLQIDSEVLKVGGVLGVATANVTDLDTGRLLALGRHSVMFIGDDGSAMAVSESLNSVFDV